ncbi:MAG: hypothetical protein ACRC77_13140 [Bacteroidales bacterium]
MQTIQEINRSVEASIGARNHTRQIYAEFICISYANIVATDMRYETDKKDIITWNMVDDITRAINSIESLYCKDFTTAQKEQYCNLMHVYEEKAKSRLEALKNRCENNIYIYAFISFALAIDAINDNARAAKGTIIHGRLKDIRNKVDRRFCDLLKRKKVIHKLMPIYKSKEFADCRALLQSNWHMERIFHSKETLTHTQL